METAKTTHAAEHKKQEDLILKLKKLATKYKKEALENAKKIKALEEVALYALVNADGFNLATSQV